MSLQPERNTDTPRTRKTKLIPGLNPHQQNAYDAMSRWVDIIIDHTEGLDVGDIRRMDFPMYPSLPDSTEMEIGKGALITEDIVGIIRKLVATRFAALPEESKLRIALQPTIAKLANFDKTREEERNARMQRAKEDGPRRRAQEETYGEPFTPHQSPEELEAAKLREEWERESQRLYDTLWKDDQEY